MRQLTKLALILPVLLLAACNNTGGGASGGSSTGPSTPATVTPPPGKGIQIGYVLHGLNDFTAVIQRGAEDAGRDLGVNVEVTGPEKFEAPKALAMFEGMLQKKKDG